MKKLTLVTYWAVLFLGLAASALLLVLATTDVHPTVDRGRCFLVGMAVCTMTGAIFVIFDKHIKRLVFAIRIERWEREHRMDYELDKYENQSTEQ